VPSDPAALGPWLAAKEAQVPGVRPEHQKGLVWTQGVQKVRWGLVYLHGYSATRAEISPVVDRVAERLAGNAYFTRLTGHGLPGESLAAATAQDWLGDAVEAVAIGETIGEKVLVIGTSTGASLAIAELARRPDPRVAGVVLISPNFGPKDKAAELLRWPWVSSIVPWALGERRWTAVNDAQAAAWTTAYPTSALRPMMALVAATRSADLGKLPPSLWVWNPEDPVIDGALVEASFGKATRAEAWRVTVGPGEEGHVLAGDILSPQRNEELIARITAFAMGL
jgi:alpha-beta hydrolase superfamily lysophospholipase